MDGLVFLIVSFIGPLIALIVIAVAILRSSKK